MAYPSAYLKPDKGTVLLLVGVSLYGEYDLPLVSGK